MLIWQLEGTNEMHLHVYIVTWMGTMSCLIRDEISLFSTKNLFFHPKNIVYMFFIMSGVDGLSFRSKPDLLQRQD